MCLDQILELLVSALVDDIQAVVITTERQTHTTFFRVEVAPEDIGKIIGKQGRTARSLRTLLGAFSAKDGDQYSLDIVEGR